MDMTTAKTIASKNRNANQDDRHIVRFPDGTFGVYDGCKRNGWFGGWPGFSTFDAALRSDVWRNR